MEQLFANLGYRTFVLQDRKRLPGRFFALLSGAFSCRADH